MKKLYISMISSFIVASIFGFWGRSMSNFLHEHIFSVIQPAYYLFVLISISVILFIISFVAAFLLFKNKHINESKLIAYHLIIALIAVPTSFWSILVFLMWIG